MEKTNICPCVNLNCANHGNCKDCTSRHLKKGTLNYCGFYSVLPVLEEAVAASPDSESAKKINALIERQTDAYKKLMETHCLTEEGQVNLRLKKSELSSY